MLKIKENKCQVESYLKLMEDYLSARVQVSK